jgi:hypothetical protein
MSGVRIEMSSGRTINLPTVGSVEDFLQTLRSAQWVIVHAARNETFAINRDQVAVILPLPAGGDELSDDEGDAHPDGGGS